MKNIKSNNKRTGQYARKIQLGHDYTEAKSKTKMPTYTAKQLESEVWVPVNIDTPVELEASSIGRIRLADTKQVLTLNVNHVGYIIACLPEPIRPKTIAVAPLIWAAWNPGIDKGENQVAFRDGNKANLLPSNLTIMPHRRAVRRKRCIPIRIEDRVYPGAAEVAEVYKVSVPTVVRWLAKRKTRNSEYIRYVPEFLSRIDGMTVRL